MSLEDIREERLKKLKTLEERGITVYPAKVLRTFEISAVLAKFDSLSLGHKVVSLAGRVMAKRDHGGSMFLDIRDANAKIQLFFKEDTLNRQYADAIDNLDIGDFIGVEGKLFTTQRGEKTIEVSSWSMASKSLRPLPEKWHGLQDVEERFRRRYLDLLMNEEVRNRFKLRSQIITTVRELHRKNGFLEVETPMLHPIPGGALARPFVTHHNALDTDFYLRIAKELYLKRLLVGGFEKVYEIGKDFRNEGIDVTHNPEFTMLECYAAYWDEYDMMKFVEKIFVTLAKKFGENNEVMFEDKKIIFKPPFPKITFKDLLSRYALITDYNHETKESLAILAKRLGVEVGAHESKGKIADEVYKKICRPYLIQPTFVVNHPQDISPLAKSSETRDEVRRFQLIVAGVEIVNGFAELNDPLEQQRRFAAQEKDRAGGEEEAHRVDEDFVEALEYGMPPAAGLGIGIDRVVMLLTNAKNIKEVVLFPTMRPK